MHPDGVAARLQHSRWNQGPSTDRERVRATREQLDAAAPIQALSRRGHLQLRVWTAA